MKFMKKLTAFILSFVMVVSLVPAVAAKADSGTASAITLGKVKWDSSMETYSFPNATANFTSDGQKIFCLSVSDGGYFIPGIDVDLGTGTEVSITGISQESGNSVATAIIEKGKKYSSISVIDRSSNNIGVVTNAKIEAFLQNLTFYRNTTEVEKVQKVTVLGNQVKLENNMTAMAIDGVIHYYKYVEYSDTTSTWYTAYNAAKSDSQRFNGMRGYLATITSADEQFYIFHNLGGQLQAWIGGARTVEGSMNYDAKMISDGCLKPQNDDSTLYPTWRWVCGPEAGTAFYNTSSAGTSEGGSTIGDNYICWNRSDSQEPNNRNNYQYADPYNQEYALEYGYNAEANWNDYSPLNNARNAWGIKGYLIEYSPYTTKAESGSVEVIEEDNPKTTPDVKEITAVATYSFHVDADNVSNPTGVTGPMEDTTASEGTNYVYNIVLDSNVDSVILTPDMANAEITSVKKNGTEETPIPADGKMEISDVQPGSDNKVTVVYTVKNTLDDSISTYTYIITRNTGADATVKTNPTTPDGTTDGSTVTGPVTSEDGTKKYTITVPFTQDSVQVNTTLDASAIFDMTYGTEGIKNELASSVTLAEGSVPGTIRLSDVQTVGSNGTISVKVLSADGKTSTVYEYRIVKEADTSGSFDIVPTNPATPSTPNSGVEGPGADTGSGKDHVQEIHLDSNVPSVKLTPDMINVTIESVQKDGTPITPTPEGGIYTVDVEPGEEVTIKYTIKDTEGNPSTYTYVIDRANGADATPDVEDPDPSTPGIPKVEEGEKTTDGTTTTQKVTITVPADQKEVTIYPNPENGAKIDTSYEGTGVKKTSGSGNVKENKLNDSTKPAFTIGNLTPGDGNKTVVSVKINSADGKSSTIYEYTIVREAKTSITPVDPEGTDTDKIEEKQDPDNPNTTEGTTKRFYKVITVPYAMDKVQLVPNLPDGATVDSITEGDVDKTSEKTADNKYTVNGLETGTDKVVVYTIRNGADTEVYQYTIKRNAADSDTSVETTIPDATPDDPTDNPTVDETQAPKEEEVDGTTQMVKDITVTVPYKSTSVTLAPQVAKDTSNFDVTYGIKTDLKAGTTLSGDSKIADNKKSATIQVENLKSGENNVVSVKVIAEDGSTCIYRYTITREAGNPVVVTPSTPDQATTDKITGPTEDTDKSTATDKYYDVKLPNGTDSVTMTPTINDGDEITSVTVDGTVVTIPENGTYTVTGVTTDQPKEIVYTVKDPSGNETKYHYTISQETKKEDPKQEGTKQDTPTDKKDPAITDITVKTDDNVATPADVTVNNNGTDKTITITVPSNQTDYTFVPEMKDPSSKITEVSKISGPAEVITSSGGTSFTAKGLDYATPTVVKITSTSSSGDTVTYTVTIYRAEEGVTPDISIEMNGGSVDLNNYLPDDVKKNAKEILYHCCAHTVLAIDKDGTVRSIGRSNKYKSSLVHVIVKGQNNKWTDYTIYIKVNGATKKEEYGTLVDYKGLNYELTGDNTCRVSSWKTNYNTKKKNIVIPDTIKVKGKTYKVTAIAPGAFMRNSKIVTIKIGKNVKEIGNTSFVGLRKLKKFTISKKNKYLKVAGKSGNKAKMILSKNGKTLYSMTNMQGSVTIPKSVSRITEYAGAGNVKMTKLIIPASVKRIDPCAFAHAKKMTYVQFKGKVPEMGHNCIVDQMNYKKGKVYVPKKYYSKYKVAFQKASKKRYGIKQFPAMSHLKKK